MRKKILNLLDEEAIVTLRHVISEDGTKGLGVEFQGQKHSHEICLSYDQWFEVIPALCKTVATTMREEGMLKLKGEANETA